MKEYSVRESWKSRIGFIFAALGSAVGLGSIWRFPYIVGENGGAAFIVAYIVFFHLKDNVGPLTKLYSRIITILFLKKLIHWSLLLQGMKYKDLQEFQKIVVIAPKHASPLGIPMSIVKILV